MSQLLCTLGLTPFIPPPVVDVFTNKMADQDDHLEHSYHQRGADARLNIIKFLYQGHKTTKQIMGMLGTTKNNVLYHMRILGESGLVKTTKPHSSRFSAWMLNRD